MIFVNFKTYRQGTGEAAIKLTQICQAVEKKTSVKIFPVVQTVDIFRVVEEMNGPIWAQHVDDIEYGQNTGQALPEAIKAAGAQGTLLNHSENKLPVEVIGETIKRCQNLKLKVLVCSGNLEEAKEIVAFKPDFLAYEPPELIGSQTASVSTAKPGVIKNFVTEIKNIPVLVGAGIHSQQDAKMGLKLGAVGILVSSDVVLAQNPEKELLDLAGGF
ncbi:MAG TPA: triose-phosphate isomerase [Nevskiaceae bacterium]|nr:triose-phosphate isomerase [Nevskiaceae bacterium]